MTALEFLSACRGRVEKATPGPWHMHDPQVGDSEGVWIQTDELVSIASVRRGCDEAGPHSQNEPDAQFIAHSRADIPTLLALVERLRLQRNEAFFAKSAKVTTNG